MNKDIIEQAIDEGFLYVNDDEEVVDERPDNGWLLHALGVHVRKFKLTDEGLENPNHGDMWIRTDKEDDIEWHDK